MGMRPVSRQETTKHRTAPGSISCIVFQLFMLGFIAFYHSLTGHLVIAFASLEDAIVWPNSAS